MIKINKSGQFEYIFKVPQKFIQAMKKAIEYYKFKRIKKSNKIIIGGEEIKP